MTTNLTDVWNESNIHYIKSYLGSILEFIEISGNHVIGTVDKYDASSCSFNLIKASLNSTYFGSYVVFENEIIKWKMNTLIKIRKCPKNRSETTKSSSRVLIPIAVNGIEEEEDNIYGFSSDLESIDLNEDDDPIVVNLNALKLKASNDVKLIEKLGEHFNKAIESIVECDSVAFALFGEDISRDGSVNLFAFANEEAIYVFEANNEIVPKLRPILESEKLQKVMFTCRQSSDALKHLFNIVLKNVLDIRIADYYLQKKEFKNSTTNGKKWARAELRSLDNLLWTYLKVKSPKFYPNLDYNQLSIRVENVIRVKTIFLREISAIIMYRIMKDVAIATQRCLESLRSANDIEYQHMKEDDRELELIENPMNLCEENERKIWEMSAIRLPKLMNGCSGYHKSSEEILITKLKP